MTSDDIFQPVGKPQTPTPRGADPPRSTPSCSLCHDQAQPGPVTNSTTDNRIRSPRRGVVRGHVVTAVTVLRTRLAEPWTLNSLADEVHLSRSQLVRSFDAATGVSPMAYLRQMRVERLARLLATTDLSVAEAARAIGWTDANYASRCFHAAYGISPSEFRHQHSGPPVG